MSKEFKVRWGWLRAMYLLTIVVAGGSGLGTIIMPNVIRSTFGWPSQDPIVFGINGSINLSFALLSVLGLRSPLKFSPILLLELCYKLVWFIGVVLPLLSRGLLPSYAISYVSIFAIFIIGGLIAIPFSYIFAKQTAH